MEAPEYLVIGLTCNLVGIFLLANSIVFRSPRRLLEEFFGVGIGSIRPIRDYVLNKIQVIIGFLFLTAGFVLQALSGWSWIVQKGPVLAICGAIVTVAALVYFVGQLYSRRSFRRYLCDFFQQHSFNFIQNMEMTKQIGKAFGILPAPEDSVEVYVAKVKRALGLRPTKPPSEDVSKRSRRIREMAPLPIQEQGKVGSWRATP
ncbi:MAG: hypothetical protein ACE5F1_16085 [Planctomycetota bacterium]